MTEYRNDTLYGNYLFKYDSISLHLTKVLNSDRDYILVKEINSNKIEITYFFKDAFTGDYFKKIVYCYLENNKIKQIAQLDTVSLTENSIMDIKYDAVHIDSLYTPGIYPFVADISYSDYKFTDENCTQVVVNYTAYSAGGSGTSHIDTIHYTYTTIPYNKYIPYQMSPFHFLNGFDALDPSFILGINDNNSNQPNKNLLQSLQSVYFLSKDIYTISYRMNALNQIVRMDIGNIFYTFEYFE